MCVCVCGREGFTQHALQSHEDTQEADWLGLGLGREMVWVRVDLRILSRQPHQELLVSPQCVHHFHH